MGPLAVPSELTSQNHLCSAENGGGFSFLGAWGGLPGNGRRGLSAAPNWHKLVKASVLIYTETGSQPGLGLGWSPVSV